MGEDLTLAQRLRVHAALLDDGQKLTISISADTAKRIAYCLDRGGDALERLVVAKLDADFRREKMDMMLHWFGVWICGSALAMNAFMFMRDLIAALL